MTDTAATSQHLDAFMAQMKDDGRLESIGQFTLNPEKALAKLREFQCRDPYEYALWVAAAAHLSGARQLHLHRGCERTLLSFDGTTIGYDEMCGILTEGTSQTRSRVGHLAVAMASALRLNPAELYIESENARLEFKDDTFEIKLLSVAVEETRFGMSFESTKKKLFKKVVTENLTQERVLLSKRCQHAGLKISFNGTTLLDGRKPRSSGGDSTLYWFRPETPSPIIPPSNLLSYQEQRSPGNFWALLHLVPYRSEASPLDLVVDGVTFSKNFNLKLNLNLKGEIHSSEFQLDLSRQNIVENRALSTLVTHLDRALEILAEDVLDTFESRPAWSKRYPALYLEPLETFFRERNSEKERRCAELIERYSTEQGLWESEFNAEKLLRRIGQALRPPVERPVIIYPDPKTPDQPETTVSIATLVLGCVLLGVGKLTMGGALVGYGAWRSWKNSGDDAEPEPASTPIVIHSDTTPELPSQTPALVRQLLGYYDRKKSLRFGRNRIGEPLWWTLDGSLEDGTHMLLRRDFNDLVIDLTPPFPHEMDFEMLEVGAEVKNDGRGGQVIWVVGAAKETLGEEQDSLKRTLEAYRKLQKVHVLACCECAGPMEKLALDVMIDRCSPCRGAWFDSEELQKVFPEIPERQEEREGTCPRCRKALRFQTDRNVCPDCQGVWLKAAAIRQL